MKNKSTVVAQNPITRSRAIPRSPDLSLPRSRAMTAITRSSSPAPVAYVTCGDPDIKTTREIVLSAIRAGADVIELGVPFSDPVADGPVIQRASERALRHNTSLEDVLRLAADVRKESDAALVVF